MPSATILGDFELRKEIGRGGMGTVYEAWQISLQRTVALKVLGTQVSSSRMAVQRFQREAQAAAKLHHTHIVPIFAQGEDQGTYFYAMELVDGPSLNAILNDCRERSQGPPVSPELGETIPLGRSSTDSEVSGPAPEKPKWDAFEDSTASTVTFSRPTCGEADDKRFVLIAENIAHVADALSYAHARGVIHRDIKPHNLMLGSDGRLRVADFGLARLSEQPAVTITGEMLGSPMYMSPEQIVEGPSKVDARTDIYSLGATLYEWLTLKPPFPGETRESVITRIVHSEPMLPREHCPDIPIDLETICLKAMERDRTRRYASAGDFRDDLRRFMANQKIKAKRATMLARTRKFIGRHQIATLAGVTAATLVLAATLGVALFKKQSHLQTQAQATQDAKADAEHMLDYMSSLLELGIPREGAKLAMPVAKELLKSASGLSTSAALPALAAPDTSPVATASQIAQRAMREFYDSVKPPQGLEPPPGIPEEMATLFADAVERRASDPKAALHLLDVFLRFGDPHYEAVQLHAALAGQVGEHEKVLADAEKLVELQSGNPNSYIWLGLANLVLSRGDLALNHLGKALELDQRSIWARSAHALALIQVGRAADAVLQFDQILKDSPMLLLALFGRAIARAEIGSLPDAINDMGRVLELKPDDAEAFSVRGDYHFGAGDFAAAVKDFDKAMRIDEQKKPLLLYRWWIALKRSQAGDGQALEPPDADARVKEAEKGASNQSFIDYITFWR